MTNRVVQHIRSNVVAYVALFVALGGTSYAAHQAPGQQRRHQADQEPLDHPDQARPKQDGRGSPLLGGR